MSKLLRYQVVICLILYSPSLWAQNKPSSQYGYDQWLVGPYVTFATFQEFSSKFGIGITYEYLLGRNFGFGGVLSGGPDYAEFSGAILGLLALSDKGQNIWAVLLIPLMVENPCIHFEPTQNYGLGLSFHLMKFRYIYERSNSFYEPHDTFASGSVTFTVTVFGEKNWQWSFYAEGTALYYPGNPKGWQVGISLKYLTE